jgi:hypothetical protein
MTTITVLRGLMAALSARGVSHLHLVPVLRTIVETRDNPMQWLPQ